jgi:adenylate cyclase
MGQFLIFLFPVIVERGSMPKEMKGELVPVGGGETIPLLNDHLTIGRRDICDIRLPFPNVSSLHCELIFNRDGGYWVIKDANSTNGIKVNGVRQYKKALMPGDEITIAKRRFVIRYTLPAGRRIDEILEDDIMSQSLLERAGLERHRREVDDDSDSDDSPPPFRRLAIDPKNPV